MDPGERHNLKRKNFIEKATRYFRFLSDTHNYKGPDHSYQQQPNGSITSDSLKYINTSIDRLIVLSNAYHPVDYGFEVQLYRPSISTNSADRLMVYGVLEEDQDIDQIYLESAARIVKEKFRKIITGQEWDEHF